MALTREVISSKSTLDPTKIFDIPVSTAIRVGDLIFCAGQVSVDPQTGEPELGTVESETRKVLENLRIVLESAGSSLQRVVKTTVFLADLGEFEAMNRVYREFFPKDPPARSTVGVQLVKGFRVEIECVALA
jgi:2-iminobutanoate/2-iminopropanoate deaminase